MMDFVSAVPNPAPEPSGWGWQVDSVLFDHSISRVMLARIDELMQAIQAEILVQSSGAVSEDQALSLARLYEYRRQVIDKLEEGAIQVYREWTR
jgi:hypothetical protein